MIPGLVLSHHIDMPPLSPGAPAADLTREMQRFYDTNPDLTQRLETGIVTKGDRLLALSFLMTCSARHRRQGLASKLMRALCALADRHGVTVEAQALSLSLKDDRGTLRQADLMRFYQGFGFVDDPAGDHQIVRRPRSSTDDQDSTAWTPDAGAGRHDETSFAETGSHDMIGDVIMVPTTIAAILETSGFDIGVWMSELLPHEFEDDDGIARIEFLPSRDLQARATDGSISGAENGLGLIRCTVGPDVGRCLRMTVVGGSFKLSEDVLLHGPTAIDTHNFNDEADDGVVLLFGTAMPDTMMSAGAGQCVDKIVRHPVLEHQVIATIDRIDENGSVARPLTRVWLQPSYRSIPMPANMRDELKRHRENGER